MFSEFLWSKGRLTQKVQIFIEIYSTIAIWFLIFFQNALDEQMWYLYEMSKISFKKCELLCNIT